MPFPTALQVNLPACSPHCPLNAERQAGKLRVPIFKVIGLTRLGIKPTSTAPEVDAFTTRPSELFMPARPTSLHLSNLLETKAKKQTHLCNAMGAIAFSYKPNPAAAQNL